MKKTIAVIVSFSFAMLVCGCTWLKTDEWDIVYNENRYVYTDNQYHFRMNYENPEFIGRRTWRYGWLKVYFSEFDTEKNIIFSKLNVEHMWVREGFEFPEPYECRLNKITTSYGVVLETETEFITINDMIGEKTEDLTSDIYVTDRISLECYLEDYKYLYLPFVTAFCYNDEIYFSIDGEYFAVKNEYVQMFKTAII